MTNSKQYCDVCGERWSSLHSMCRASERRANDTSIRYSLFDSAGKRLSTVRLQSDKTLFEISPLTATTFKTEAEWKAAYPTASTVTEVQSKA